ncbi:MAG: hypothetical protein GC201_17645 [Alphaproteobacteria bacterium]|nr:hypothetical protein [Alphaproteobacteria bacterium]
MPRPNASRPSRRWQPSLALLALLLSGMSMPAAAQQTDKTASAGMVSVELNKLEPVDGACRVYLLLHNATETSFDKLQIELVSFEPNGEIGQRIAVDLAPLQAGRTVVRLFDLPKVDCRQIAKLLLNDVIACSPAPAGAASCLEELQPSSRAGPEFWK